VIGCDQSAIALATATTNANGEYTLNIVPTSNPVIIEVKAIAGTTMLDETQIDGSGNFTVVPAELVAPGLTLRSFNSSASEAALVRINPLTETAVAIAAQTKDANGKAIGLTADALRSAKQIVLEQLAPEGVNPFITVPPTTWANASEEQKRLVIFAAGLMKQGDVKVAIG
jgi:hypothetical protein